MSFGAGSDKSQTDQYNTQNTRSDSFVWDQQAPFLQQMWGSALDIANPERAEKRADRTAERLSPFLKTGMKQLSALGDPTQQIAAQSASLQSGLGSLFREEINPAITTGAVGAGGLGGGRQGVAQGVATGQLADAFTQGYGDIVARANQTAIGANTALTPLASMFSELQGNRSTAGLDPLAQLAAIIGSPTLLQSSRGKSRAGTESTSSGWKASFGLPS